MEVIKINEEETGLPLGILRHAVGALDIFTSDINEAKEDEGVSEDQKQTLDQVLSLSHTIMATIVNMVSEELSEEEFLNETIEMEEIEHTPFDQYHEDNDEEFNIPDLLDQKI